MAKSPSITVKVVETNEELVKRASAAIMCSMGKAAKRSRKPIEIELRKIITDAITESFTYQSVLNEDLREQLGIPDGEDKFAVIIGEWVESLEVTVQPNKGRPKLLIRVLGIDASYKDVLALPEATQENVTSTGRPTLRRRRGEARDKLEWLRWLLIEGAAPIIVGFEAVLPRFGRGRAGSLLMKESPGRIWRIPQEFQGTPVDNFVTRVIEKESKRIIEAMTKHFKKGAF